MRRRVGLICLSLFSSFPIALAATPPKFGNTCPKSGVSQNYNGLKFTCIKSGKKLIWDKGIIIKKALTSPSASPTPVASPSPMSSTTAVSTATPSISQSPTFTETTSPSPSLKPTQPASPSPMPEVIAGANCTIRGQVISLTSGNLVCRYVKGMELKYTFESGLNQPVLNSKAPDSFDTCRIKDLRVKPLNQESIAFPVRSNSLKNRGVINWAIVPVDFSDAPGVGNPSTIYLPELKKIDEWIKWYTNDKLKVNWVLKDEWIRAPLESQKYAWIHPGSQGVPTFEVPQLLNELAKIGEKNFDYSGLDAVHYLYPLSVTKIYDALTTYGSISTAKVQYKGLMNTANGYWLTNPNNRQLIWAWMIHEIGHPMGLTGHSPINPNQYGIMQNQGGMGLGLQSWDSLILDWINEDQVYCSDLKNVNGQEITLVPKEREQTGISSVMIRISDHQVLVVESHRADKWSFNMQTQNEGVMAYLVDTSKNTIRDDENNEFSATLEKTAWNISVENWRTRIGANQNESTIMYLGDSLSTNGVRVTFIKSGDNDTIKIEKA